MKIVPKTEWDFLPLPVVAEQAITPGAGQYIAVFQLDKRHTACLSVVSGTPVQLENIVERLLRGIAAVPAMIAGGHPEIFVTVFKHACNQFVHQTQSAPGVIWNKVNPVISFVKQAKHAIAVNPD